MLDLLVASDDRTGALEVAGTCADAGAGPVLVLTGTGQGTTAPGVVVVDLDSRHRSPALAAARAASVDDDVPSRARAHKIDSTLRGNWHHEVVGRAVRRGLHVLVVPAFPALGRTCVNGIVRVDGVAVSDGPAGSDPLAPVRSSRPAELLDAAGADGVVELGGAADVTRWLASGRPRFAICDARSDDDLRAIATAWAPASAAVLLAGTAAAIAPVVGALGPLRPPEPPPPLAGPVLVVCGSVHPVARRQLAVLGALRSDVEILSTPEPAERDGIGTDAAQAAATELAERAHRRLLDGGHRTVVVIGGDTAAAWLGDRPVLVGGTIDSGLPWLRGADGAGPLVLTRSGGFGGDHALVELLHDTIGHDSDRREGMLR